MLVDKCIQRIKKIPHSGRVGLDKQNLETWVKLLVFGCKFSVSLPLRFLRLCDFFIRL